MICFSFQNQSYFCPITCVGYQIRRLANPTGRFPVFN